MDYKEETKKTYDKNVNYFDQKFEEYKEKYIKAQLEKTLSLFPKNAKILDLGSGPGNHAKFFDEKGFDVLCLDISEKSLEKCREKGLKTINMDFEKLEFPEKTFDVIWAYTSLIHIPKSHMLNALRKINTVLKDNGFFFISMKEGKGEGFVNFKEAEKRWFALYEKEELENILKDSFQIIDDWKISINENKKFRDYLCKKLT